MAIIIGNGPKKFPTVDLMNQMLDASGNPSPTKFDNTIAAKLTQAAESVRMTLRDHIILADEQYYSFKDNKKL